MLDRIWFYKGFFNGFVSFQEIIRKDEEIGSLRTKLKHANDEADARSEEIAELRSVNIIYNYQLITETSTIHFW